MVEQPYPLIIVFYLNNDLVGGKEVALFAESVNQMIEAKNSNVMAFFLPTKGEDRIECLNPVAVNATDMNKITEMIEDIRKSFSIGIDIPVKDEYIELDSLCECGRNPKCECDNNGQLNIDFDNPKP